MRSADRTWKISRHLVPGGSRDEQPSQGTARSLGYTGCSCCSVGKEMITTQKRPYSLKATTSLKCCSKWLQVTSPSQATYCMCERTAYSPVFRGTVLVVSVQGPSPAAGGPQHHQGMSRSQETAQRPLLATPEVTEQHFTAPLMNEVHIRQNHIGLMTTSVPAAVSTELLTEEALHIRAHLCQGCNCHLFVVGCPHSRRPPCIKGLKPSNTVLSKVSKIRG